MKLYLKALASIFASPKAWWDELYARLPENNVDQFWLKYHAPKLEPEAGARLRRYIRNAVLVWIVSVIVGGIWLSTTGVNFLFLSDLFLGLTDSEKVTGIRTVGLAVGTLAAGLLAVITLANSLNRTVQNDENIANEHRKSDAEIFARSTDQLGNEKTPTRLGALYALEALAKDTLDREGPKSHLARQILETLAAFIRERSGPLVEDWEKKYTVTITDEETKEETEEIRLPYRNKEGKFVADKFNAYITTLEPAPEDIQAAFKIIIRSFPLEARPDSEEGSLNLSRTWLAKVTMPNESGLQKLNLNRTHMEQANLSRTHMEGANLFGVHMEGANLIEAHMQEASLIGAHMERAYLFRVHMEGADLFRAQMETSILNGAHLERADLTEARMQGVTLLDVLMEGANLRNTDFKDSQGLNREQLAVARWYPDYPPINVPKTLLPLPHDGFGNPLPPNAGENEES